MTIASGTSAQHDQRLDGSVERSSMPNLVIITGMSGAGRTEAMHVFEDMGYFCVDNLPAPLISELVDLRMSGPNANGKTEEMYTAVVCDARNHVYFEELNSIIRTLDERGIDFRVVFLDAADEKLISRYKSSRRRHPLCDDGSSIAQHGAPVDADVVIDVRFLPNPYYDPELKNLTGLDDPVRKFVMDCPETELFKKRWFDLLDCVMPGYVSEGKQQLAIAVGCTGGQHISVALAEATGDYLKSNGYRVSVAHRDLMKAETAATRAIEEDGSAAMLSKSM